LMILQKIHDAILLAIGGLNVKLGIRER